MNYVRTKHPHKIETDVGFGSVAASQHVTSSPAAIEQKADVLERPFRGPKIDRPLSPEADVQDG
jgi:hypothetical protein